jgi:putative Ig domain-containing protein
MKNHLGFVNAALRTSAVLSEVGVLAFVAVLLTSCGGSADLKKVDPPPPSTLANTSGALPTSPVEIVGVPFDKRYACFIWGGSTSCKLGEWRDGFPLTASGGVEPYQWTWAATAGSSLPPGLSISTRTYHKRDWGTHLVPYNVMAIAGIPTQAGDFNVIVTVTDSASPPAHVRTPYTIHISASGSLNAASSPAGETGASVSGSTFSDVHGPEKHHTRYKVIDTGSFGGPNSHVSLGAHVLNNSGTFTGYADTAQPDPYAPDACWDGDCLVAHVFQWKNGELSDLGVLDAGPNSESNWMSENGLIVGDSQNGLLDPLVGFWQIRAVVWKNGQAIDVGTLGGGYNSLAGC